MEGDDGAPCYFCGAACLALVTVLWPFLPYPKNSTARQQNGEESPCGGSAVEAAGDEVKRRVLLLALFGVEYRPQRPGEVL